MTQLIENKLLDVPPQMALAIASGIEDPALVAERHGFDEAQWEALKIFEPFVKLIEAKKTELRSAGVTFRLKSRAAGLDAPPKEETNTGATFSININLGQGKSVSVNVAQTQNNPTDIIDVEPELLDYDIDLGKIPWHLRSARSELCLEME